MTTVSFANVDMHFHQQDGGDECGNAVAQMILGYLAPTIVEQDTLQGQVNKRRAETGASNDTGLHPDEVCFLLNKNRPTEGRDFTVCYDMKEDAARRLFTSLMQPDSVAVPVSILGGSHWVAVSAVAFDATAPGEPEILGFFVDNPEPMTSGRPIPGSKLDVPVPHTRNDTCGHGRGTGSPKTFVTLHEWLEFYWATPFDQNDPGSYVTIPRGDLRPLRGSIAREVAAPAPGKPQTDAELSKIAMDGIERYGLSRTDAPFVSKLIDPMWNLAILVHLATPSDIPSLRSSEAFHIVHVMGRDGVTAHIRVGADDGRFLEVEAPAGFVPFPEDLFDFASAALERHETENGLLVEPFSTVERRFTVHPTLIWCPCRQSMSPFQPFVQVNLAGRMVFVSMDGLVHDRLDAHRTIAK